MLGTEVANSRALHLFRLLGWKKVIVRPFRATVKRSPAGSFTMFDKHLGLSENRLVPLNPMVYDHYPYEKLLFHWEY